MTDAPQTDAQAPTPPAPTSGPAPVPLLAPREGVPEVVAEPDGLSAVVATFAAGTGPVAVDAERASGYRYGQRAYLVQLRREGAGTALVDPIGCGDLSSLGEALADTEWVLHAASQDLPCLRDIGMTPATLFDTELAGRLAGFARVGLGVMVEAVLGYQLEKGHSAVDWSTRPLPEPWLRYAALDVELLVDLRDALEAELRDQGKLEWALEEFAAIAAAPPPPPRKDPWRRTSGMHKVRRRRQMAAVRELWTSRDELARERDLSPGKVLPDAAIVAAALAMPADARAMAALPGFGHRVNRRMLARWQAAVDLARELPERDLPQPGQGVTGPPPPRAWADKDPVAAARLTAARKSS
ncbi:HRDC domain-containing protein [Streptomyces bohaiensis]|uniref:HRDC domain-containing protein n=1 Tax=Streptomyces bohaiensis TaxID=1431344 RepID=UPI0028ADA53C|nr:HRDC domain-containing protein [Streptomyces bohaiensis]